MEITKAAMISMVGRPNTGKSTLTNALVGQKIAITSPKPQTTRTRITGIAERRDTQLVFLDTPGFHAPRSALGEHMVRAVSETISEVDAAVMVIEPQTEPRSNELELISRLKEAHVPVVLVVNKIDTVKKEALFPVIAEWDKLFDWAAVVPVCAKNGEGTDELADELMKFALPGGRLFPEGMTTDQPDRQLAAELIREKLLMCLGDEIPHGTAVEITGFEERDNGILDVNATIYCEKASHKGIIIGKNGAKLKEIGEKSRKELERLFGSKVFLQTWVKVKENWRDSENFIHIMGMDI